jgi:hypothetical protein
LFLLVEGVAEFLVVGGQPLVFLGRAGGGLLLEGAGDAALGDERLLSEVAVELYAATARMRLRPASSAWRRRFSLGSRSRSSGD